MTAPVFFARRGSDGERDGSVRSGAPVDRAGSARDATCDAARGGADLDPADPRVGQRAQWSGLEAHHACNVQRLGPGSDIELIDGAGTRIGATIAGEPHGKRDKTQVAIDITSITHDERPTPRLVLVQALAKSGRDEQSIEMATEIGVDTVIPWKADRCVVKWQGPREEKGLAKWENVLTSAVKQSRRSYEVALKRPVTTAQLAAQVADATADGDKVLLLYENATDKFAHAVADLADFTGQKIWLIVGPEGGISEAEVAQLVDAGAVSLKLGQTIMRVSSAGCAALAVVAVSCGQWG